MTRAAVELARFLARLVIAIGIALAFALVLGAVREGSSFADSFRIACYVVGALALLMAFAGHSPAMRLGVMDPLLTSFFPKLVPQLARPYSGTTLSASALLALTGLAVLGLAVVLDSTR